MLNQSVCIFTHFKEICFLLSRLHFPSTVWTFSIYKLRLCPEGFTWSTVQSFVRAFINVSFIIQFFKYFLHLSLVIFIRCPDKFIIRSVHQIPDLFHLTGNIVHISLRRNSRLFCFQFNLLSVLIRSSLKEHIISLASLISCNCISQYNLIGVSNMRFPRCISNRCRHIKLLIILHFSSPYFLCINSKPFHKHKKTPIFPKSEKSEKAEFPALPLPFTPTSQSEPLQVPIRQMYLICHNCRIFRYKGRSLCSLI